jgi:hypothetical protein
VHCKIIFNFVNLLEASLLCSEISVMSSLKGGRRSRELDLQLPMRQSVPITTDVVTLNLDQEEVYNIM